VILRDTASSDVGRVRSVNQDRFARAPDLGCYLVADGMGGHQGGEKASQLAVEAVLDALRSSHSAKQSLSERLRYALAWANRRIFETACAHAECAGMGTTIVALLIDGGRAALAHVGDSRAYLIRDGGIRQLTRDHSIVGELLRRQQISEQAARAHPHRHVLTRALGVRPSVEPDLLELALCSGDVFALCTDGLTGYLQEGEIAEFFADGSDLEEVCKSMIEAANSRGGEDNITAVLVRYETPGER